MLALTLSVALSAAAAFHPTATLVLLVVAFCFAGLWWRPSAIVLILIAFMGNTKFNIYLGVLTVFPEYVPLLIMAAVVTLRWMGNGGTIEERGLLFNFGLFFLAGCLSFVNAINIAGVFSRAMFIPIIAFVTWLVVTHVSSERALARALRWLEISALVMALYGIAQIVGTFIHWDVGLRFLHRWGNPTFEYAVGAPFVGRGIYVFRANSLFNDPNILAGYLAAAFTTVLALRIYHGGRPEAQRRAHWETALLAVLLLCVAFSISRTGMLGVSAGAGVVLGLNPQVARAPRFWLMLGLGLGVVLGLATFAGVNPGLLASRVATTFDPGDFSSSAHRTVAIHALSLFARFPVTGIGLANYGYYYGSEVDARGMTMMAHNAILSYFAEAGLLGGVAFLALCFTLLRRPWRALHRPGAGTARPALHAATSGLLGAVVALLVSNLTYDFSLRTFVWVYAGLALAASRLLERDLDRTPAIAATAS